MQGINLTDIRLFVPEIILAVTIMAVIVADLIVRESARKRAILAGCALVGVIAAALSLWSARGAAPASAFYGQIAVDPVGNLFKLVFLAITGVTIFTSQLSAELPDRRMGEYFALLLSVTFGMFLMAGANDLLMVYLGIEMVSIVSYGLAGYRSHDRRSSEAALKYVIYGGAASGLMLFGMSLFYGLFGHTELTALYRAISAWDTQQVVSSLSGDAFPLTLLLSFVFIFAGIGYKIAVVPFHMWCPDVYEGAPTPISGFLSVGPKAAGFALLMRVFIGAFVDPGVGAAGARGFITDIQGMMQLGVELPLPAMLGIVAALTMTAGNLAAIGQDNVKRLLAYSSIAHAGYLLMGFVVLSEASVHAVTFYLIIYFMMNLGAFTVVQAVRDATNGGETIYHFRGLGQRRPMLAIFMTIFLVSLTGLPPVAGFIGKFYIFAAVIERGGYWYVALAVVGVVNSAISLFYYFRISQAMWFTDGPQEAEADPRGVQPYYAAITGLLALPTLVLGIYWSPISETVRNSMAFYRSSPAITTAALPTAEVEDTAR